MNKNLTDFALAVLRIGFAGMMLTHGIAKLPLLSNPEKFPDPFGLGSQVSLIFALLGEVVAPVLVILGYRTKLAAIPIIITMLVASFVIHGADPFASKELALLYLVAFVTVALSRPGKYSLDSVLAARSSKL